MKPPRLLSEPWAITREAFEPLLREAVRHADDPRAAKEALEARLMLFGRDDDEDEDGLDVRPGGVAVIPVRGYLTRRAYWRGDRASYQWIGEQLTLALERGDVRGIVLEVDTAGGQLNGCEELSSKIFEARREKPVRAVVLGQAASAGYWIASSASAVDVGRTSLVGSIGVIWTFFDWSKYDEEIGLREIDIVSSQSPDKNLDPTTAGGRALVQATVDQLAGVFVADVARNRGVSEAVVVSDFGGGWMLVGEQARAARMADRVATFDDAITMAAEASPHDPFAAPEVPAPGGTMSGTNTTIPVAEITADWLAQHRPEVATALREAGATAARTEQEAAQETALEAARTEVAEAERTRILGIQAHACEGAEEIIAQCVADPAVTPDAAAGRVMTHLRSLGSEAMARLRSTEPANPPSPSAGGESNDSEGRVSGLLAAGRRLGLVREEA